MAKIQVEPVMLHADFMVSRVAAVRTALQTRPSAVSKLLEMEFTGRTCAHVAIALSGIDVTHDRRWLVPFRFEAFARLLETTRTGKQVRVSIDEQANLLRRHVHAIRGGRSTIYVCDTGVFGSIGHFLNAGFPTLNWISILLFRFNYKRAPTPHFRFTTGLVSDADVYKPWRARTAINLYWQFMEAALEPKVPSVRWFREGADGQVVSNLQVAHWEAALKPERGSIAFGAFRYIEGLSPESVEQVPRIATEAWKRLQRKIIFPTATDVGLLSPGERAMDFGVDDVVTFADSQGDTAASLRAKVNTVRESMWPEGDIRRLFPRSAVPLLATMEACRAFLALYYEIRDRTRSTSTVSQRATSVSAMTGDMRTQLGRMTHDD